MAEPRPAADDIAEYLGVNKDTIYPLERRQQDASPHSGRFWKLRINEIDDWVCRGNASSSEDESRSSAA